MTEAVKRVTLKIPLDDEEVIAWCKNQGRSLSMAVRLLIQKEVHRTGSNGIGNYFATKISQADETKLKRQLKRKSHAPKSKKTVNVRKQNNQPKMPHPEIDPDVDQQTIDDLNKFMMQ